MKMAAFGAHVAGTGNSNKFDVRKLGRKPLPKIDTRDRSSAEQQALYKRRMITQTANLKSVRAQVMKHVKDSGCTMNQGTDPFGTSCRRSSLHLKGLCAVSNR
jgi:hypothetical protein